MLHLLVIDRAGPHHRGTVDHLVDGLRGMCAVERGTACSIRLAVQLADGLPKQPSRTESVAPHSDAQTTNSLVLVLDVDPTSLDEARLRARLTAAAVEPFGRLGLCTWKAKAGRRLTLHSLYADLAPVTIAEPRQMATLLAGLGAYLQGEYLEAGRWLEQAKESHAAAGHALLSLTHWCGLAHLGAGQKFGRRNHFEAATNHLTEASLGYQPSQDVTLVAAVHRALAQSRYQRPAADPNEDYPAALDHLGKGLSILDASAYPVDRARLLFDRASVHLYIPRGRDPAALDNAQRDLGQALAIFRRDRFPLEHSDCLNALGRLHAGRYGKNRFQYQNLALSHYRKALRVRKKVSHPWHYAQTQHNLGQLFLQWINGNEQRTAGRALRCFKESLTVFKANTFPHRHLQSLAALGRAYVQRNARAGRDLRDAIRCFEEIVSTVSPQDFPYFYGRTLFDLGNAQTKDSESAVYHPAQAIEQYRGALVHLPETCFPIDRAHVLVALAGVLMRYHGRHPRERLVEALSHYVDALSIFQRSGQLTQAACVHASLAGVLLAAQPRTGSSIHEVALRHQQAARELLTSGCVQDESGNLVLALVENMLDNNAGPLAETLRDGAQLPKRGTNSGQLGCSPSWPDTVAAPSRG